MDRWMRREKNETEEIGSGCILKYSPGDYLVLLPTWPAQRQFGRRKKLNGRITPKKCELEWLARRVVRYLTDKSSHCGVFCLEMEGSGDDMTFPGSERRDKDSSGEELHICLSFTY